MGRTIRSRRISAILLGATLLLQGCASFRSEPTAPALPPGAQSLYALKSWRLEGRIGVQTSGDAWQANLFWEHAGTQDRLRISGPLSQGMVSIIVQKDLIYINEGNGVDKLSKNPEAELRERLGFSVPLSSLRYWILGVPAPDAPYSLVAAGGFQQLGWTIRVDKTVETRGRVLPSKMRVENGDVAVKLKIVADTWEMGD